MSVSELTQAGMENTLAVPRGKPGFAQRFYLPAIIANALVIGVMGYFFQTLLVAGVLETSFALGFAAAISTFAATWGTLVLWRQVRHPWIGLAIPLVASAPAFLFATNTLNASWSPLSVELTTTLTTYVLMLGLVWVWGFRLHDPSCRAKAQPQNNPSMKSLFAALLTALACREVARRLQIDSIENGVDNIFIVTTAEVAILAFVVSSTGYAGWLLIAATGAALASVSKQLSGTLPYFSIDDPLCATHYTGTILLLMAAMTLPWLLSGWRIVWTPPLWERAWHKTSVATGGTT